MPTFDRPGLESRAERSVAEPVLRRASSPGPREIPRLLWTLNRDPLAACLELCRSHGPVAGFRVLGTEYLVITRPDHAEHVLIKNQDNYHRPIEYRAPGLVMGEGLLTTDDSRLWRSQRSLIQPLFTKRRLEPFVDHIVAVGTESLELWRRLSLSGEPTDISSHMSHLTLDVMGRALFGADVTGRIANDISKAAIDSARGSMAAIRALLPRFVSLAPAITLEQAMRAVRPIHARRLRRANATFDRIVEDLIARDRDAGSEREDNFLTLLLGARDETSEAGMSDQQARDEMVTFIGAGHETTAQALSWSWLLLSRHPDVRERMHAEIDSQLQGRPPAFGDLDRLPYTSAVVREALRLYPPIWVISRQAYGRDSLDGTLVSPGTIVVVLTYSIHRDPDTWPRPDAYDPSRFLADSSGRPRHAFMPFGAGRHVCVGAGFALMEATMLTALIAQRYQFDLVPESRIGLEAALTLRPRPGVPMTVSERR